MGIKSSMTFFCRFWLGVLYRTSRAGIQFFFGGGWSVWWEKVAQIFQLVSIFPYDNLGFPAPEVFLRKSWAFRVWEGQRFRKSTPIPCFPIWRSRKKPKNQDLFRFFQVSFLIWGSKKVKLTGDFSIFRFHLHPTFPQKTTLKGMIGAPYTIYPLQKGKACILISNRSRSKKGCVSLPMSSFSGFKVYAESFGLILEGFRSINSLTDSDLDHQHRTFSFLFLRSQGLTKSRVLEWKGPTYVPLDMNLTYYLIDMKYLSIFWETGFKQNWQQTCLHLILHINLIPTIPPSLKTWSPPPYPHFPHLRHVLLMLLSLPKAE